MEAIRTYINNLFEGLAQTPEAERLRLNMLRDSEERYDELRAAGHSEAEALGLVIQQFGNFEDIRAQFGAGPAGPAPESAEELKLKSKMREDYEAFRPRFSIGIAAGVFMCLAGIIVAAFVSELADSDALTALGFFLPVGLGVALFIIYGTQMERYKSFFRAHKMYEFLDEGGYEKARRLEMEEQLVTDKPAYAKRNAKKEALSGTLWILATVAFLLMGFLKDWWHPGWIVFVAAAALQQLISVWER